jgi:hypothetical protein
MVALAGAIVATPYLLVRSLVRSLPSALSRVSTAGRTAGAEPWLNAYTE